MAKSTSRKRREREQHRYDILVAAEAVFAEKGYHGSTIEDVAEQAEFSVGTLYNFFPSKEDMYFALLETRTAQLKAEAAEILDQASDPVDMIKIFIKGKIQLTRKYVNFTMLYTRERMGDRFLNNELWSELFGPFYDYILQKLVTAIQEGIREGTIRSDIDPYDMVIAIDGLSDGFMFEWLTRTEDFHFEDKYMNIVNLVLNGVLQP